MLELLEGREKPLVVAWLREAKASGSLASLKEVTCDMWEAYANAAREVFGDAVRVTVDRFHVMKNFQECLEQARRAIQRALPKDQAEALKGSRWLWITNPQNLSPEQRRELARLQRRFPELAKLSRHRERLRRIFEDHRLRRPETATTWLRAWCERGRRTGLTALEPFYRTLESWMGQIANYFAERSSNGRTEGFNRGLRAILWRACGMTNFAHLRLRVLDAFG